MLSMYAYLNSSGDVLMVSTVERTLEESQSQMPLVYEVVSGAPAGLATQICHRPDGEPSYFHRKVSGDGTDLSHYTAIPLLDPLRQKRFAEIDAQTHQLIDVGFEYQSKWFSLSISSQNKIQGADSSRLNVSFLYPVVWNTKDDLDEMSLSDANAVHSFYETAVLAIRAVLDSGTALKSQIRQATTKAEIEEVVDSR